MNTNELWDIVKLNLSKKRSITKEVYNRYIEPAELIKINDNQYYLVVNYAVAKNILADATLLMSEIISEQTGNKANIAILTTSEYKVKQSEDASKKPIKKYAWSFANFVVGPSNNQAFLAAQTVAKADGSRFNPLFIYGNSGLGKTHLLKAIMHSMQEADPNKKVIYLTSEKFGNEVVEVIQKGYEEIEKFKDNLKTYDVLLIDDVQFLAKKEKTNEIFFTIFNEFVENNKQIAITSDKSPEELNGFDQRMITRFNSGLTVKIEIPDMETAVKIIQKELNDQHGELNMSHDAVTYLATYFATDVRKIKGVINRLLFIQMSSHEDSNFTLNDIVDIFKGVPSSSFGKLDTKKIKEVVAKNYGVSVKLIDGKTRTANVIIARHVAMYLTKNILNKPLTQIGVDFGGKDHTTVMNAVHKIEKKLDTDKEFNKAILKIRASITEK